MRLRGGRTGKKVLTCEDLSIHGLTRPFDLEVHFGERIAVVGANGTGKSHFLNLLAQSRDGEQDVRDASTGLMKDRIDYQGTVRLGARVQPGLFIQNRVHPEFVGKKLIEILHRGAGLRAGTGREKAMAALGRYELAARADEYFENLSGGEQARFQILDLELGGLTCFFSMSRLIILIYIPRRFWSRHSMHLKGPFCPSRMTAGLRSLSTASSSSQTEGSSSRPQNLFGSEDYSDDCCDLGCCFLERGGP